MHRLKSTQSGSRETSRTTKQSKKVTLNRNPLKVNARFHWITAGITFNRTKGARTRSLIQKGTMSTMLCYFTVSAVRFGPCLQEKS